MIKFLKFIFNISIIFLVVISLFPGSLIGYLLYRDWGQQPDLIQNPFGTSINHFIYYLYASILGFLIYLKNENFQKIAFVMLFLSVFLEISHLIIPNRSFQTYDLLANLFGVIVAYSFVKIYLLFKR